MSETCTLAEPEVAIADMTADQLVAEYMRTHDSCYFNEYCTQYRWKLVHWLMRERGLDTDTAEEIAQECMFKLFRRCQQPESIRNVRAYVLQTACHEIANLWRKRGRRNHEIPLSSFDGDDVREWVDESVEQPGTVVCRAETIDALHQTFEGMSERHGQLLQLVDLDGFTYNEAAETLDIPIGTVRSGLSIARKKLHDTFPGCYLPDGCTIGN